MFQASFPHPSTSPFGLPKRIKKSVANRGFNQGLSRICLVFFAVFLVSPLWVFAGSDTIFASQDTFVGNNGPFGSRDEIVVGYNGGDSTNNRIGVIQFRVNPIVTNLTEAALLLDVARFDDTQGTFYLWGVTEGAEFEEFDEDQLKRDDWWLFDGSSDGVVAGSWRITNLGQHQVSNSDVGQTVRFSGTQLEQFLSNNQNTIVTLIIARKYWDSSGRTWFASKEHATLQQPRLFIAGDDKLVNPAHDTYVRYSNSGNYGQEQDLFIKMSGGGNSHTTRKGLVSFYVNSNLVVKKASLLLDLSYFQDNGGRNNAEFFIYGLSNGSHEYFNEHTAKNGDFGFFNGSPDGIDNQTSKIFDGNLSQSHVQALGILKVWKGDQGDTIAFTSDALIDFVNHNDNSRIAFAITRKTDSGSLNTSFASKEHPSLNPPRLYLEPSFEPELTTPDFELANIDADGNGSADLVLLVNAPGGGGFAIAEPFIIAEYLVSLGFGIGKGNDYYNNLSNKQKSSLKRTLYELSSIDAKCDGTLSGRVDADFILDVIEDLPTIREYPIKEYWVRTNFEENLSQGHISLDVELDGCNIYSYAHGDLDVSISHSSANAGLSVSENAASLGGQFTYISVSVTYGNENGTHVGFTAGVGTGLWAEGKFGENGQYGFSAPIPGTAFGVSIYIKGNDAVAAYNQSRQYMAQGYNQTKVYFEGAWADSVDWSEDTWVSSKNLVRNQKVQMRKTGNYARVWVSDNGSRALTELKGGSQSVKNAMQDATDDITQTSQNMATSLENWADGAGSVVVTVWNDSSGWVKGSANSLAKGIKKVIRWF